MKILTNILNPVDAQTSQYLDNHVIETEKGKIVAIYPMNKKMGGGNLKKMQNSVFLPPLIDAHTHLPQYPIVGKYGHTLIEWLNNYTYPAEMKFAKEEYAKELSAQFFSALKKVGTATAVIYSTIHKESTDIAFEQASKAKIRTFMGKVMMDQNSPTELSENPIQSLCESHELCKKWHQKDEKTNYIYTPRFAISTSKGLLSETGKLSRLGKIYIQTHMNENIEELELLQKIYPETPSYAEIYSETKILGPNTLLAHCIHNTREDLEILEKTKSNVIHCPDANFFLKSGTFPLKKIQGYDIPIGLGSDVGAGTTLDMFEVMKSMIYMQKELVPVSTPFYYSTLGNAKILDIDSVCGSIDVGKNAEFLKIDMNQKFENAQEILNHLIFTKNYKRELIV